LVRALACVGMYVALSYSSSTWNGLQWQKIDFQVVFCFVLEVTTCIGGACIFIIAGSTSIWFFFPLSPPRLARYLLKNPFPLGPFLKIGLCHFYLLKFNYWKLIFVFFYFPFYWIILIIFFLQFHHMWVFFYQIWSLFFLLLTFFLW
jgi:hypothetical protein